MRRALLLLVSLVVLLGVAWVFWPSAGVEQAVAEAGDGGLSLAQQSQRAFAELSDAGVRTQEGVVVEADGRPAPGVRVELYVSSTLPEAMTCPVCGQALLECTDVSAVALVLDGLSHGSLVPPQPFAVTTTDADGRYVFSSVPDVEVQLIARRGSRGAVATGDDDRLTLHDPKRFTVHVQFDGSAEAAPGVRAWVMTNALDPQEVTSNSEGDLQFSSIGDHGWVHAAPPGFLATTVPTEGADLVLLTPRTLLVHTRVGGQPVDADVALYLHNAHRVLRAKDGELRLEQLNADTYELQASTPSLTASSFAITLDKPVNEVTLELRASGRLLVTVVDEQGLPVKGATAELENSETNASVTDPGEGQLLELGPLPEGDYHFTVTAEGMREYRKAIDLKPGDHALEVTLTRAATLTGRVLGPSGPIADADVTLSMLGASETSVTTKADGTFSFEGPPLQEVLVTAVETSVGRAEARAALPGTVELRLEPRAAFELEVLDHQGLELHSVTFAEQPSGASFSISLTSASPEQRRFTGRVAGLHAGRYALELHVDDREAVKREYTLVDGAVVHDSVTLSPGVAIEGLVQDAAGHPLPNAAVLTSAGHSTRTDEAGHFVIGGLQPGPIRVNASPRDGLVIEPIEVVAPARGLLLKAKTPRMARGRVVGAGGRPLAEFEANGQTVKDPGGRFEVPLQLGRLGIWAEGYQMWSGEGDGSPVQDFGTITLVPVEFVEGEVVDLDGKPLGGVMVRLAPSGAETATSANGRFKLEGGSGGAEERVELVALRGPSFARAPVQPGTFHRLRLQRGTHVTGRVVVGGRPAVNASVEVEADGVMSGARHELTDAQGRFEVDLWPGVWMFTASGVRLARAIEVSGAQMNVELTGEGGRCSLELRHASTLVSLMLQPNVGGASNDGAFAAGTVQLEGLRGRGPVLDGLPCGDFVMILTFEQDSRVVNLHLDGRAVYDALEPPKAEPAPDRHPPPVLDASSEVMR